jgi:amino acid transporter
MYLINFFGFSFIALSLAEMSSMAPTAGGQYREFPHMFRRTHESCVDTRS